MHSPLEEFNAFRSKMNEKLLAENNKLIKSIFNIDTNAYEYWEAMEEQEG